MLMSLFWGFEIFLIILVGTSALLSLVIILRQLIFSIGANLLPGSKKVSITVRESMCKLPSVTILIPAHNEQDVLHGSLQCMSSLDYPRNRLNILVINDRSSDKTGQIADSFAEQYEFINVLHRKTGDKPGKPAALQHAIQQVKSEIIVLFDADYLPSSDLLLKLIAPFEDPGIGAVMGRVVPYNADTNLLTMLLDLERRGGYAVDLQMRQHWNLLPQFGGTCGAIRVASLEQVGGWSEGVLAEDTDLTYRLFLNSLNVAYLNKATCYEEVPEDWQTRYKQVWRWAYGHNECLFKYLFSTLFTSKRRLLQRLDASLILLFYLFPVLSFFAIPASLVLPLISETEFTTAYLILFFSLFIGLGNLSTFFQVAVASKIDNQTNVLRYAPLMLFSSIITMVASVHAVGRLMSDKISGGNVKWTKTKRFRISKQTEKYK